MFSIRSNLLYVVKYSGTSTTAMDLKRWKIFQKLDPTFVEDVKWAYLIGINGVVHTSRYGMRFVANLNHYEKKIAIHK